MSDPVLLAVALGLLGLIIGSFVAAVTVRLPRDQDIVMGRSRCMTCERPLAPWHLIPVVSWLVQRGRCGWCGAAVSTRYILIELAAAGLGVWAGLASPDWVAALITAVLGWQLLLIAFIDGENFWLPDELTLPLAATGLAASAWLAQGWPVDQMIGLGLGFGLLWLLAWLYRQVRGREGLGGGDPFLFAGAGAWVGWIGLPSVLLWACAVGFSLILAKLLLGRSVQSTDRLPFGTFLCLGVWLVWLYGPLGLA